MDPVVNNLAERFIPVAKPTLGSSEAMGALNSVNDGWISLGPRTARFEQVIAEAHGHRKGVATCAGTTALHLALAALGVRSGDKVICPTMTMVAVPNAIRYLDATPVFIDSEAGTGNMNIAMARERASRGDIKAAIVAHLYGVPAGLRRDDYEMLGQYVPIIEDCAECHYARHLDGTPVGSKGIMSVFSFYANKIITTGEGGMVITSSEPYYNRLTSLRAHAFTPGNHFHHKELAYGYRMPDVLAAIGLAQHDRRKELLEGRERVATSYTLKLAGLDLEKPALTHLGRVWWVYPILVGKSSPDARQRLREALASAGVDTRTYFWPMHEQPFLKQFSDGEYPVACDLAERGLYLPLYPDLQETDIEYICAIIHRTLRP